MRCFRCDWRAHGAAISGKQLLTSRSNQQRIFNAFIPPGEWFDLDEVPGGCCIHADSTSSILRHREVLLCLAWPFQCARPSSHGYLDGHYTSDPSAPHHPTPSFMSPAHSHPPTSRPWGNDIWTFETARKRGRRAPMCRDETWISQEEPLLSNGTRFMKEKKKWECTIVGRNAAEPPENPTTWSCSSCSWTGTHLPPSILSSFTGSLHPAGCWWQSEPFLVWILTRTLTLTCQFPPRAWRVHYESPSERVLHLWASSAGWCCVSCAICVQTLCCVSITDQ